MNCESEKKRKKRKKSHVKRLDAIIFGAGRRVGEVNPPVHGGIIEEPLQDIMSADGGDCTDSGSCDHNLCKSAKRSLAPSSQNHLKKKMT